jgi:hypothetical protein
MRPIETLSGQAGETEFPHLKYMKGLGEALVARVTKEYGTFDLGRLRQALPEVQRRVTEEAFEAAGIEYTRLKNYDKRGQLEEVKTALGEGRLSINGLIQGLGLGTENSSKGRGLFGRIKSSLGKTVRT